ncbi:MAG: YhbY family RNA-binding protein [Methanomicrobiales archaeon]
MSQYSGNKKRGDSHGVRPRVRSARSITGTRQKDGEKSSGRSRSLPESTRSTSKRSGNNLMQDLKPTVWIGKQGCTETIISEVIAQLKTRKVIKVKWLQNTEVSPEELACSAGARLIQVRGRTLVLEERRKL